MKMSHVEIHTLSLSEGDKVFRGLIAYKRYVNKSAYMERLYF